MEICKEKILRTSQTFIYSQYCKALRWLPDISVSHSNILPCSVQLSTMLLIQQFLSLWCWLCFQCSAIPVSHTFLLTNLSARYCHAFSISTRSHREISPMLQSLVSLCFRFSALQSMAWTCLMNVRWLWSTLSCYKHCMHSRTHLYINRSHSTRIHVTQLSCQLQWILSKWLEFSKFSLHKVSRQQHPLPLLNHIQGKKYAFSRTILGPSCKPTHCLEPNLYVSA